MFQQPSLSAGQFSNSALTTPQKPSDNSSLVLTPNTRQRKSRLADKHNEFIKGLNLANQEDAVDVVILSLRNLGLYDSIKAALTDKVHTSKAGN